MNANFGLNRNEIFRNTGTLYRDKYLSGYSEKHKMFCENNCGKRVLDVGCATGNLCVALKKDGYECVGVDINEKYVQMAIEKGVDAYLIKDKIPFEDKSFDTITLFEVIEHVDNPAALLKEAKRVARKNILISVPNCSEFYDLKKNGLTYEHFLELDHKVFFTKESLSNLLSEHFSDFDVQKMSPVFLANVGLPWWIRKPISFLHRLRLIKATIFSSLFAVINIEKQAEHS